MSVMCIERFGGAMSEKMRTAKEWLAFGDELAVKLAEVFMPGPWKHNGANVVNGVCDKCGKSYLRAASCPVPDPIVIDWKNAKYWQGKCNIIRFQKYTVDVMRIVVDDKDLSRNMALQTLALMCRPEDAKIVLIIAVMAIKKT